jgi:hypothetical protein
LIIRKNQRNHSIIKINGLTADYFDLWISLIIRKNQRNHFIITINGLTADHFDL